MTFKNNKNKNNKYFLKFIIIFFAKFPTKLLVEKYTYKSTFAGKITYNFFLQEITCEFKIYKKNYLRNVNLQKKVPVIF